MEILAIYNGEYGKRHYENILQHAPASWDIKTWEAPAFFPLVIDYPEDFLPQKFEHADLILSFAEHKGVAELLPDIAQMTGAKAVIASIDRETWLPRGLARQLRGWLDNLGVACATPKPLCSLTTIDYGITMRQRVPHHSKEIATFAEYFGQPKLELNVDPNTKTITQVQVKCDAVCGAARYVAGALIGIHADDAEEKAGLLHHHYPCMASMDKDPDFNMDTLMHASGHVIRNDVGAQIKPFKSTRYYRPGNYSE